MQLSHELDVTEELVLAVQYLFHDIRFVDLLTCLFGFLPRVTFVEEVFEARLAVGEQSRSEVTALQVGRDGSQALRLELYPHDGRAQLAVEVAVCMLGLCLPEDGMHDNVQLFWFNHY